MRLLLYSVLLVLTLFSLPAFGVDPTSVGDAVEQLSHTAESSDHGEDHGVQGLAGSSAFTLVLMTLGAIAMPSLAKRIAIPVAVAEILYGFIIGDSGFGFINECLMCHCTLEKSGYRCYWKDFHRWILVDTILVFTPL